MEANQLMKQPVVACESTDSLETAARIMWENDCGCVPVQDGDGHLLGMITDRDVCMAAYLQGGPLRMLYVASAMSREVFSCRPDSTIADCEAIMQAHQVRRLPVVDDAGKVIGILSLNDVARSAAEKSRRDKSDVTFAAVGKTLQSVSTPRRTMPLARVA